MGLGSSAAPPSSLERASPYRTWKPSAACPAPSSVAAARLRMTWAWPGKPADVQLVCYLFVDRGRPGRLSRGRLARAWSAPSSSSRPRVLEQPVGLRVLRWRGRRLHAAEDAGPVRAEDGADHRHGVMQYPAHLLGADHVDADVALVLRAQPFCLIDVGGVVLRMADVTSTNLDAANRRGGTPDPGGTRMPAYSRDRVPDLRWRQLLIALGLVDCHLAGPGDGNRVQAVIGLAAPAVKAHSARTWQPPDVLGYHLLEHLGVKPVQRQQGLLSHRRRKCGLPPPADHVEIADLVTGTGLAVLRAGIP